LKGWQQRKRSFHPTPNTKPLDIRLRNFVSNIQRNDKIVIFDRALDEFHELFVRTRVDIVRLCIAIAWQV
jgi:hypothetical protein